MSGVVQSPDLRLTEEERGIVNKILGKPLFYPEAFKGWLADYVATNIPKLPISQVFGFKLEGAHVAPEIFAQQSTSSTVYTDLTTVGPELTQLSDGFYLVLFGAFCDTGSSSTTSSMSPSWNGSTAVDADRASGPGVGPQGRALVKELRNNHVNSIQIKYKRSTATTGDWEKRWLVAMRVTTNA
jgi:hypothetical protein